MTPLRKLRIASVVISLSLCLIASDCDPGNPIAPSGSVLSVSANPTSITTGESSTITVTGFRPDGNPLTPGTQLTASTNLGMLSGTPVIDTQGRATLTLTSNTPGTATVTVGLAEGQPATASVDVEITAGPGLGSSIEALVLNHSRSTSNCDDEIGEIPLTNDTSGPLNYRIVGMLPAWLKVSPTTGSAPATLLAEFTCMVGQGNLDLQHTLVIQGVDPNSGVDVGAPVAVQITVFVRP